MEHRSTVLARHCTVIINLPNRQLILYWIRFGKHNMYFGHMLMSDSARRGKLPEVCDLRHQICVKMAMIMKLFLSAIRVSLIYRSSNLIAFSQPIGFLLRCDNDIASGSCVPGAGA